MTKITTIKIFPETKERLDKLKESSRESYDHVLRKILYILSLSKKAPEKARKRLLAIDAVIKREELYYKKDGLNFKKQENEAKKEQENKQKENLKQDARK